MKFDTISLVWQAVFVLTGAAQTISIQFIVDNGGAERSTLIVSLAHYLAMIVSSFCVVGKASNVKAKPESDGAKVLSAPVVFLCCIDLIGGLFLATGQVMAGSGLFQVFYSTVLVFAAIHSRIFLKKPISFFEWAAIALITVGLMSMSQGEAGAVGSMSVLVGVTFVLCGSAFYGLLYVWSEKLLTSPPYVTSTAIMRYVGLCNGGLVTTYFVVHTVPNWNELVVGNIAAKGGDGVVVAELWAVYFVGAIGHYLSYYAVLESNGSVVVGVLKAVQAVSVFVLSSWLFCAVQTTQCLTPAKMLGMALVLAGMLGYSAYAHGEGQVGGAALQRRSSKATLVEVPVSPADGREAGWVKVEDV